ncbi:hypothetical protein [Nocardia heshunensis]
MNGDDERDVGEIISGSVQLEKVEWRMSLPGSTNSAGGLIAPAAPGLIGVDVDPNTLVHQGIRHIVAIVRVPGVGGIRQFRPLLDDDLRG